MLLCCILITFLDILTILSSIIFVETAMILKKSPIWRSIGKKQTIAQMDYVLSQGSDVVLKQTQIPGSIKLRTKRHQYSTSLYDSMNKASSLKRRLKKGNDAKKTVSFNKRDFFFAPAPPYEPMSRPVDRRMFLVHRGERGPCFFHACHHGGMCVPRRHGFYCECLPGFIGTRCEVKKECRPSTCKNGGTCTEIAVGRHLCTCPVGFLGENCETRSLCHPTPCRNDGTCSESEDSYTCVCPEGFKGKNCEIDNKCLPNPCKNDGVCFEMGNSFICNCPQGFKGKTCEVISECNSVYCLNGGTCRDESSGYRCDCRFGFYGKRCEASACHPSPCHNNGVCLRFGNQYSCQCKQGFSGKRCKVSRPCSLGICLNGGTCVDGPYTNSKYGFACVCQQGFDGIMCEKRLPDNFGERLAIL